VGAARAQRGCNGALLCRYHHQLLHREGWTGQLDAKGRPEYRPPATIDPNADPANICASPPSQLADAPSGAGGRGRR
jgi:hypothetical protein